ncbi:MAG TPA: hypothetical protein VFC85_05520 [Verrucomicrobiae bacterium]|nr:hypothetical protein [Verrucomicrobiae bacterium]
MSCLVKPWLASFDWKIVTEINRGLCSQKNALHKPTSDGHEPAKILWEKNQFAELSLTDALQVCLQCHRLAPFCFYNGNTFAAIARDLIAELSPGLAADKTHILRSIAGHIVAGTATDIERKQLDSMLAALGK